MADLKIIVDSGDVVEAKNKVSQLDESVNTLGKTSQNAGSQQQVLGKRANRAGVLAQQAGYQFGDFAVQVQSGTNIMVAAGQQATQLVGTFSMLAKTTKGIMAFSALGVLIPIITGIGAAFMRTGDAAKESSDGIQGAFGVLPDFFEELSIDISDSFSEAFARIEDEYSSLFGRLARIKLEETKAALVTSFETEVTPTAAPNFLESLGSALAPGMVQGNAEATQLVREETEELYAQSLAVREIEEAYVKAVGSSESMSELVELTLNTERELAAVSEEAANAFAKQAEEAGIVGRILKDSEETVERIKEQAGAHTQALREQRELSREVTRSQADRLALAMAERDHGRDSVEYARLRAEQEGISKGLVEGGLQKYIDLEMVIRDVAAETKAAAVEAALVRDGLSESVVEAMKLAGIDLSTGITPAVLAAGMLATNLGIALSAAQEIQLTQASLRNRNQVYSGRGTVGMPSETGTGGLFRPSSGTVRQADILLGLRDPDRAGGGGGGAGGGGGGRTPFDQDAYLQSLQDEANFKQTLVKMTEEQATEEERRREIMEKMTQDGQTLSATDERRIQTILDTEAATRSLIETEEQRQATFDMVSGHIESAFMSMVDGSKSVEDAFKGMLRAILLEIYQQQVVQPMANAITTALGFNANGNAFSGGNVIPFANGGVVSSATLFPMAGNQTGVMGEAGPEAIMPLKRGANGKLGVQVQGGGENVVIHQNFNFQANGDDSVKRIIAQAAPQIANMTKKSMMDDRRRGGQMKTTFG